MCVCVCVCGVGEHNCYAEPVVVDFKERKTFFVLLSTESPVCFDSMLGDLPVGRVHWGLHVHTSPLLMSQKIGAYSRAV